MKFGKLTLAVLLLAAPTYAPAAQLEKSPDCLDRGVALPLNNAQVVHWKSSTQNQFQARAHVQGPILAVYPDHSGHHHFKILLDGGQSDTLEVIFNEDFGAVPALRAGMQVEACGDYITSIAQSGVSEPSAPLHG